LASATTIQVSTDAGEVVEGAAASAVQYLASRSIRVTNREIRKGKAELERFMAVFERDEDGWWVASCLEVPEAIAQDKTIEEARETLKDAVNLMLEVRREDAEKQREGREMIREPLRFEA
jgi:predicted RNase H-like HicB family nuclease